MTNAAAGQPSAEIAVLAAVADVLAAAEAYEVAWAENVERACVPRRERMAKVARDLVRSVRALREARGQLEPRE